MNFKLPHEVIRVWFREDIDVPIFKEDNEYLTICHVRQLLLAKAKHLDPDYAIFVDDDVMPPKDLIKKVVEAGKDLLGGYYYRNFPEGLWIDCRFWKENGKVNQFVDEFWLKYLCQKETPQFVEGDFIIAEEFSGGCMALSRLILNDNRLSFYPRALEQKYAAEDFGFCIKANEFGYKPYVHRFLRCFHILDKKTIRPWTETNDSKGECVNYQWEKPPT
jgi:GT2 family glycosyltransferase